jgi:hypothetical protein
VFFEIHEVYYDETGRVDGITAFASAPMGNTVEELREELQMMLRALDAPVLEYDEIANPKESA